MITATIPSKTLLNFDHLEARKILLPQSDSVNLVLVGCGGTGSWLAPTVARVARLLKEKFHLGTSVTFIDPDRVEAKNCYRQNFSEAEIGRSKAETLAYRYGLAWGVEITVIPQAFGQAALKLYTSTSTTVLIGCVDRASARAEIAAAASRIGRSYGRVWWLDCGNEKTTGQVVLGGGTKTDNPFGLPGLCTWLPWPSERHPELLEARPEETLGAEQLACLSCADLALQDSQGLSINQVIASLAGDYLVRLLVTKDLTRYATYVDLGSGSVRSSFILT